MKSIFLPLLLVLSMNLFAQEYSKMCYYSAAGLAVGGMTVFTAKQAWDTWNVLSNFEEDEENIKSKIEENFKKSTYESLKKLNSDQDKKKFLDTLDEIDQNKNLIIAKYESEFKNLKHLVKEQKYKTYVKIANDGLRFVVYPFILAALLGSIGFGLSHYEDRTD